MKNTNFTFYENLIIKRKSLLIALLCCLLTPLAYASSHQGEKVTENEKIEIFSFNNEVEIQKDEKGKFIEIYDSPFLAESERVISSKLMNNKKVKEVLVSKADKTITIYFRKDLSDAEIKNFARIYFNK